MFKQIVVGVDEHEGGRDAVALAKNLLARDGELTLRTYSRAIRTSTEALARRSRHPSASVHASCSKGCVRRPASRRICAGADPFLWDGGCTSFAK